MDARKPRVLVLDDDELILLTLQQILTHDGFEVETASDAASGMALLAKPFDVAILDLVLGDGTGLDVVTHIRQSHIPIGIIALSGYANLQDAFALGRLGVDAFLAKPVEGRVVCNSVRDVIHRRSTGQVPDEPIRPLQEVLQDVRRTLVRQAVARADGNKRAAAKMLGISRQHLQQMVKRGILEDGEARSEPDGGAADGERDDGEGDGQRDDGQRDDGQRDDGQRDDGQRDDGQRDDGQRDEAAPDEASDGFDE